MRIAVIGAGGREHALAWTLSKEHEVVALPGNPGISNCAEISSLPPEEFSADLFVIGPEAPLVEGLADRLRDQGKVVFGPSLDGARLEGSKAFMKEILQSARVPTADFKVITSLAEGEEYLSSKTGPYVVKTDGLAGGKGVLVTESLERALEDLRQKLSGESFAGAGRTVVIEEAMDGPEVSILAIVDGKNAVALPVATDFKRALEGDLGPNTGGMGAHSPVPWASQDVVDQIMDESVMPVVRELQRRGIDYRGVLYAGLMFTRSGPKVVEFNVRFGDPEAQVVLPRVSTGLGQLLFQAASGHIEVEPEISPQAYLTVAMTSKGYPVYPGVPTPISGLEDASAEEGVVVYHSGTAREPATGEVITAGGRVLTVTGWGDDLVTARERAYTACGKIHFEGAHYRRDIGLKALGGRV